MHSIPFILSAAAVLASTASAEFNSSSASNIAVYWGQNSYGSSTTDAQQDLALYCANTEIDIIPMAFLYQITSGVGPGPVINFANSGNNCTEFEGTTLLDCSTSVGPDITTCQEQYGKTILLSIGGATYTEGGFTSETAAVNAANLVWQMFGPYNASANVDRPFGTAVVDGFDFDFETTVSNTVAFANQLRALMDQDTSKPYYLSAAPQCPYPDAADGSMLDGAVSFDMVFVQYYNNYCASTSYIAGATTQNNFNFDTWDLWARTVSKNPDVKVFLGVPAGPTGAGSGYESASALAPVIEYCQTFSSFGGVMMWDASQAYAASNAGFLDSVYNTLEDSSVSPSPITSTTTVSATATATSSVGEVTSTVTKTATQTVASNTTVLTVTATVTEATSTTFVISTTKTATSTSTAAAGTGTGVAQWDQCGGNGYTGSTTCASPYTCVELSQWWSQCE